jgi:hypothetical protein
LFKKKRKEEKKENVLFRTMMEMPEAMDDQGRGGGKKSITIKLFD